MSSVKEARVYFSKVKVARELLRDKADELLKMYLLVIDEARASGDYETAAKSLQWLIDHMADEEGNRVIERSVDKQQIVIDTKPTGPAIQIGIAVGGVGQKALPEKPVDVQVTEVKDGE